MIYNFLFKFILLSYIVWDMLIVALRNIQIGVQRSRKLPFWMENTDCSVYYLEKLKGKQTDRELLVVQQDLECLLKVVFSGMLPLHMSS